MGSSLVASSPFLHQIAVIDILDFNHFDIGSDSMLAAEIEHLLGFGDATDEGSV